MMRQRFMRVLVFFDLPVETKMDRRNYSKFRKLLLEDGFVMMQKSVYSKIVLNGHASELVADRIRNHKPSDGKIQILTITEKQFQSIEYVLGEPQNDIIDCQTRLVVL